MMKKKFKFILNIAVALGIFINTGAVQAAYAATPQEMQGSFCEGERLLYPGGMSFGVKFFTDGLVIVGFTDVPCSEGSTAPAYDAGLRVNDIITKINGNEVKTSADLAELIEGSGEPMEITYKRNGEERNVVFAPVQSKEDGKYKTGMWIRDTTAGIGTVTFIVPETGSFAGLGHGICDTSTGELMNMTRGTVVDVEISGITKGLPGTPGELKGYFKTDKSGVLLGNTRCGVYGILGQIPYDKIPEPALPVADKSEVSEGCAWIWSTLDDNEVKRYEIEITSIDPNSRDNRNFEILVKDPELLKRTGGIVQGMSGSPIIQNGHIIGAVTHVMINDPTRGYGIFIENMINEMPELMK